MTIQESLDWLDKNETRIIESMEVIRECDHQRWIGLKRRLDITG